MARGHIMVNGVPVEIILETVPEPAPALFPDIPSDDEEIANGESVNGKVFRPCIICVTKCQTVIFVPCGHVVFCSSCNRKYKNPGCPVCRQPIGSRHRIYL